MSAVCAEDVSFVGPGGCRLRGTLVLPGAGGVAGGGGGPGSPAAEGEALGENWPTGSPSPSPLGCVVLLHGLLSHRDHNFAPSLCDSIARRLGLAAFRFDFRGAASSPSSSSSSSSSLPPSPSPYALHLAGFDDEVEDVECAVRYLTSSSPLPTPQKTEGGAGGERPGGRPPLRVVCLLGHSRGANTAILAAAKWWRGGVADAPPSGAGALLSRPISLVAVSPRFHMEGMLGKFDAAQLAELEAGARTSVAWATKAGSLSITAEDVRQVRSLDMRPAVGALAQRQRAREDGLTGAGVVPFLLVHGDADTTIPVADSVAMAAAYAESAGPAAADADPPPPGSAPAAAAAGGLLFRIIEGASHTFSKSKHSGALEAAVLEFLSRHVLDKPLTGPPDAAAAAPDAGTRYPSVSTPALDRSEAMLLWGEMSHAASAAGDSASAATDASRQRAAVLHLIALDACARLPPPLPSPSDYSSTGPVPAAR